MDINLGEFYFSIGSVTMGIAGSIVNDDFFQEYLGMRNESVDEVEILRRMDEGIYDPEEFKPSLMSRCGWVSGMYRLSAWSKPYLPQLVVNLQFFINAM